MQLLSKTDQKFTLVVHIDYDDAYSTKDAENSNEFVEQLVWSSEIEIIFNS